MKIRLKHWFLGSLFVVYSAFGNADAQNSEANARTPQAELSPKVPTSPEEQLAAAEQYAVRAQAISTRIRHMLDDTRKQNKGDVLKLTCLGDKLAQIQVTLQSIQDHQKSLKSIVESKDLSSENKDTSRKFEFSILLTLRQNAEQLDADANLCVGEEIGLPGQPPTVQFVSDPTIVPLDPNVTNVDSIVLLPPLPVSPYL